MTFFDEILRLESVGFDEALESVGPGRVTLSLGRRGRTSWDFLSLLSPVAARSFLEDMAQEAHRLTVQHFGRNMFLFTPIYVANYCVNYCVYCGFNATHDIERRKLTLTEVEAEARTIASTGLQHILLLTGGDRLQSPVSYITDCVSVLRRYFSSVSIEVYPFTSDQYVEVVDAGVDGLTLFQEVYDRAVYSTVHPRGPKHDYRFRLEAPERAGGAGIRSINIGPLLGLTPWRREVFLAGLHAAYLQERFPDVEISMSLPRMRPQFGGYEARFPLSDRDLVQAITALRLFLPRLGITISTRETAELRDHLIGLGVTKMSAGSSTAVGGHTDGEESTGQFEISDRRSVEEMRKVISDMGYKPVLKDWHELHMRAGVG